jgi:hypothetical protein
VLDPFVAEGEWLRCALHAHTTRSDGELAPEALAAHYARAGYDVLAMVEIVDVERRMAWTNPLWL